MKVYRVVLGLLLGVAAAANGEDLANRAWELETKGDASGAQELLQKAAQGSSDPAVLRAYAEFLDRHRDPAARAEYERLLTSWQTASPDDKAAISRRLAILDLLAGDSAGASKHLEEYRTASGKDVKLGAVANPASQSGPTVEIPGPMRSFARMAALAPDLGPEDLMPALARNVVTNGYQALSNNDALDQTEYLKLVVRYLSQARELDKLGGADKVIKIETCESTQTADLLRVLGYRMRGSCGSDVVLETVNATRAFLTIDSGFPLAQLEQALRTNRPFVYEYKPSRVPVLYGPEYWLSTAKNSGEFIDAFLADPQLCRLYLGFSKLDPATAGVLKEAVPVARLKTFAHVLDFYGGLFEVRNGRAVVPGGAGHEKVWADIAGASPEKPGAFFEKLLVKDDGWLASYFDALLRISGPTREYLIEPERLKRFYTAIKGRVTSPGPARPVFRANTDMLLLTTRLRVGPDGKPVIPGSLEVWKDLFIHHPHGKYDGKLTKSAQGWKDPDDLVEALFGLCRKAVDNEPLKMFMAVTDVERNRPARLAPATAARLVRDYRTFGSQYSIFNEAPGLSDATIVAYLEAAAGLNDLKDQLFRTDAIGTFQALVSAWQICTRQGSIPADKADATLAAIVKGFSDVGNSRDLFDSGRDGVRMLLAAANIPANVSAQDGMLDLMAGTASSSDADSHLEMVQDMIRIFEAQRLISLQTLFELGDNLEKVASGDKLNTDLVNKLASRIAEVQLPRGALTTAERSTLAYGYYTEKHIDAQRKMNLRAAIEKAANDPQKLKEVRGALAPFLRDTLVGLNYIHYAPPGGQILMTNPVFVRSHDFLGLAGSNQTWRHTEVFGTGWPANAGGRLVGSLAGLPYALAEAEQNFLIPSREQALIWGDLVPQLLITAKVPRWWNVTPSQLHWVGLHMSYGESLVAESAFDPAVRTRTLDILDSQAPPARVRKVDQALERGDVRAALEQIMPSELFLLAAKTAKDNTASPLAGDIVRLAQADSGQLSYPAISHAFGTPKPTLSNSYRPELLNLRTFPTLMGYSSRIMAESWESNLLYYAGLADEIHASPGQLNVLIPTWTQQTVEKIFATHLEDWPALLRSLRTVGDEVRQKARKQQGTAVGAE